VQDTLQAQIQAIEDKGDQKQGAILESIQTTFQPISAGLEGRDEQLTAFVGKLRENLTPLRNDLEKVEKTRDEQHWMVVSGLQQQTAAIKPLHDEVSSSQAAANQNFHTVVMKLDDSAATMNLVNKKVNTIGQFLWGGLRHGFIRLNTEPAPNSFLEQSLEDSRYKLPECEDEEGWLIFQDSNSKTTENLDPIDKHHDKNTTMPHTAFEALGDTTTASHGEANSEAVLFPDKQLEKDTLILENGQKPEGSKPKRKSRKKVTADPLKQTKPAENHGVEQNMELLEAIMTKITALEERTRDRETMAFKQSDFAKLEKATAAIVQAYQGMLPMQDYGRRT